MLKRFRTVHRVLKDVKSGQKLYKACKKIPMGLSTWYLWEQQDERLNTMRKKAEVVCEDKRTGLVVDALFKNALQGATAAQIFYLKNRGWKDSPLVDQSIKTVTYAWQKNNNSVQPPAISDGNTFKSRTLSSSDDRP